MTDPSVSHQSTITTQSCFSDILSEKQCLFVSVLSPLKGRFQSPIQHIFKYTLTWFIITHLKHHKNITSHTIGEHHNFLNERFLIVVNGFLYDTITAFFIHKYYWVEMKGKLKVIISGRYDALCLFPRRRKSIPALILRFTKI